jgi:hypothetical protein
MSFVRTIKKNFRVWQVIKSVTSLRCNTGKALKSRRYLHNLTRFINKHEGKFGRVDQKKINRVQNRDLYFDFCSDLVVVVFR